MCGVDKHLGCPDYERFDVYSGYARLLRLAFDAFDAGRLRFMGAGFLVGFLAAFACRFAFGGGMFFGSGNGGFGFAGGRGILRLCDFVGDA